MVRMHRDEEVRLHLGCGRNRLDGYINIDIRESVRPDLIADVLDMQTYFQAFSVDEVYAPHVLEHLPDYQAALLYWVSLLRPEGLLRVAVPDLGTAMNAYVHSAVSLPRLHGLFWGGRHYGEDRHQHGWDYETLASDMRTAGLFDIQRWSPEEIFPLGYDDCSFARIQAECGEVYRVSLNLEGKKR
jgi:predicted SAM-dependent methyltransferase